MMQRFLPFTLIALMAIVSTTANAQSSRVQNLVKLPSLPKNILQKAAVKNQPVTGFEDSGALVPAVPAPQHVSFRSLDDEVAGTTGYDNQTNACEQARVHRWPNGDVSAAWTFSAVQTDDGAWADRGSAVNRRSNWSQTPSITPTTRLESVRTGFVNYVVTDDGTELSITHTGAPYKLHVTRRLANQTTWTESNIPSATPSGQLWCKAAADGNNVYVIALTTPTGFNGVEYRGMNGHVLFWRSKDAGATWDIKDGIIPGLDSSAYASIGGDDYTITARNGVVAVGVFNNWNPVNIFRSDDGGTTWNSPYTMIQFPLHKYVIDQGYSTADIGGADPNRPSATDSLAIFTNDGHGSILLDNAGFIHAWVGEMWVSDDTTGTAGSYSYYPGINGVLYWNEYKPDSLYLIAGSPDLNGNGVLDITGTISNVVYGGCNISSMPSSAITSVNDTIYVAYAALIEGLNDQNTSNPFRHVLIVRSVDFGTTWQGPYDVHYLANNEVGLADFQEGVFPNFNKYTTADGKLDLIYQRDYTAGSAVIQTGAQPGLSDIVYVTANELPTITKTNEPRNNLNFTISPNPADTRAIVNFDLKSSSDVQINVFNAEGSLVSTQNAGAVYGHNSYSLNTGGLANGLYYVRIRAGNYAGTSKLTVAR
jgi:hypothetical protein